MDKFVTRTSRKSSDFFSTFRKPKRTKLDEKERLDRDNRIRYGQNVEFFKHDFEEKELAKQCIKYKDFPVPCKRNTKNYN